MHLFYGDRSSERDQSQLRLLCAYENGSVTLRGYQHDAHRPSIEGLGWDTIWSVKLHVESGEPSLLSLLHIRVLINLSYGHGRFSNKRPGIDGIRGSYRRSVRPRGKIITITLVPFLS